MRLLIWHVDGFVAEPTERGRSSVADAEPRTVRVEDGLVVFAAVEKKDEAEPEAIAERATAAIVQVAKQLGARTVVLHSFAHLFVELSRAGHRAADARRDANPAGGRWLQRQQTAFGWFNRLEHARQGPPALARGAAGVTRRWSSGVEAVHAEREEELAAVMQVVLEYGASRIHWRVSGPWTTVRMTPSRSPPASSGSGSPRSRPRSLRGR